MIIIVTKRPTIIEPTSKDYKALGIKDPNEKTIQLATLDDIKQYAGQDFTVGVPIVKVGPRYYPGSYLYSLCSLYAPRKVDYKNLGMGDYRFPLVQVFTYKNDVAYILDNRLSYQNVYPHLFPSTEPSQNNQPLPLEENPTPASIENTISPPIKQAQKRTGLAASFKALEKVNSSKPVESKRELPAGLKDLI